MNKINRIPLSDKTFQEWLVTKRELEKIQAELEVQHRENTKLTPLENFLKEWKKKPNANAL
ncbi:hypothetical protein [Vibrio methylphosphonaticus]|uniref:hypothetical protein n=1 Tax=Vibrio methylphosphonaticus TaxID=2946866 RepID=UPI002029B872|nr:hypothetical protein [Vibrio methylphosphonaticus]MCL9776092.1 hypothetical protein [Vibrio methylphosphonaticus]